MLKMQSVYVLQNTIFLIKRNCIIKAHIEKSRLSFVYIGENNPMTVRFLKGLN